MAVFGRADIHFQFNFLFFFTSVIFIDKSHSTKQFCRSLFNSGEERSAKWKTEESVDIIRTELWLFCCDSGSVDPAFEACLG